MIRIFLSTWSTRPLLVQYTEVINPILEYLETIEYPDPADAPQCRMFYPDHDQNGLPDKNRVLILVRGGPEIEGYASLPGVKMLPPYPFDTLISDIPSNVVQNVKDAIVAEGIPLSALAGITYYGQFVKKIIAYFQISPSALGKFRGLDTETQLKSEFA